MAVEEKLLYLREWSRPQVEPCLNMHEVASGNAFSESPVNTDTRIMHTLACLLVHVRINRAPLQCIIKRKVVKLHTKVSYNPGY